MSNALLKGDHSRAIKPLEFGLFVGFGGNPHGSEQPSKIQIYKEVDHYSKLWVRNTGNGVFTLLIEESDTLDFTTKNVLYNASFTTSSPAFKKDLTKKYIHISMSTLRGDDNGTFFALYNNEAELNDLPYHQT